MPSNSQDPNILRPSGVIGAKGVKEAEEQIERDIMRLKDALAGIGDAIEKGLDPSEWMQDLAMLRDRNAERFKRITEDYDGAAKHFINKLSGLSLSMADSARMCEKAQAELRAKAQDYTRAFVGMGVAGEEAAKQGKAAVITGFGDAASAFVSQIRKIDVLGLTGQQRTLATKNVYTDRDKALAGNPRMLEMMFAGDDKSKLAAKRAIGTTMKDTAKEAGGVGGGGIVDLMNKGGAFNKAIASSIQSQSSFVGEMLGKMAANDKAGDKGTLGWGLASKALGSLPQMFQQLIGYAGQFTAVAMSWGLIIKILTEVVGAIDFYRKMEGISVGFSAANNSKLSKSYSDVASAITDKTSAVRADLIFTGKAREIEAEAAETLMKSNLAAADAADKIGELTDSWMRATIVGAEFGMTVSESISLADKVTKAFGKNEVPENMRRMLEAAAKANMSLEDMNASLGDAVSLSMKFGRENALSLEAGAMLSVKDNESWAQKISILKTYGSLLSAPLTYKAGLVMGANMSDPDRALGELYHPPKGLSMLDVMGRSIGAYMKIVDADLNRGNVAPNMKILARGAAYGAFYQNQNIAETYAFLEPGKRKEFDKILRSKNKKDIDEFLHQAGMETEQQRGLTAMEKQVSLLEKVIVTLTSGFQWVLDAMPFKGSDYKDAGENFRTQVDVNDGKFTGIG